jgi:hypothetical protein
VGGDPVNHSDRRGLQKDGVETDPFSGLVGLIEGRLRQEFYQSITSSPYVDPKDALTDSLNRTTANFRLETANAMRELKQECRDKMQTIRMGPDGTGAGLFEAMVANVAYANYANLKVEIQQGATIGQVGGGGAFVGSDLTLGELYMDPSRPSSGASAVTRRTNALIVILPGFRNESWLEQRTTLVHEMLHLAFDGNVTHAEIAERLGVGLTAGELGLVPPSLSGLERAAFISNLATSKIDGYLKKCMQ